MEDRLQQLEDEQQICGLAASFADACTVGDMARFKSLWAHDAMWKLGAPHAVERQGIDQIMDLIQYLANGREFFIQFIHSGVIEISGNSATARWIVQENAKGPDAACYRSSAIYHDTLTKVDGEWLFTERNCQFLWVDSSPF